ncbi:MAG: hypothetical protein HYT80_09465 [Euryarchaeota archaeon]|nr:hypothetical protein [Euryarchaeota archaeon]
MRAGLLVAFLAVAGCLQPSTEPAGGEPSATPQPAELPAQLSWRNVAAAPTPRVEHSAALVGDRFYVVGGFIVPFPVTPPTSSQTPAYVPTPRLEIYDPATDRWTTGADFPMNLDHAPMVGVGGKAYVFFWSGGASAAHAYDPATNAWTKIADMPRSHNAGAAVVIGERVFVVGGSGAQSTTVDVYDSKNNTWSSLGEPMPTRRDHFGAAVVGGRLYAVAGDVGGHSRNTGANEVFDPATGEWSNRTAIPKMRGSVSVASWLGRVVVLGGQNGPNGVPAFADVDAYEPITDAWVKLPDMPSGRHGFPSGIWRDKLYTFAGAPQMGVTGFDRVDVLGGAS